MKEYDSNRIDEYNRKYKDYLIGKEGDYKCHKCKKVWTPTDDDMHRKVMMTYYRCCGVCRLYSYNKGIEYRKKREGIL